MIRLYRRELQRNYVMLLLVGVGAADDPQGRFDAIDSEQPRKASAKPDTRGERSAEWLTSPLDEAAVQYRNARKRPSEYTAAMRDGLTHLYTKVGRALKKTKDPRTAAHLRDLRGELRNAL